MGAIANTWGTRKKFRDFNGIQTHGVCVSAGMLYHLSYKAHTLGAGQFVEFILIRERCEFLCRRASALSKNVKDFDHLLQAFYVAGDL